MMNIFNYNAMPFGLVIYLLILHFMSMIISIVLEAKFELIYIHKIKVVNYILEIIFSTITLALNVNTWLNINDIDIFIKNFYFINIYYFGMYLFEILTDKNINKCILVHHIVVFLMMLISCYWLNSLKQIDINLLKLFVIFTFYTSTEQFGYLLMLLYRFKIYLSLQIRIWSVIIYILIRIITFVFSFYYLIKVYNGYNIYLLLCFIGNLFLIYNNFQYCQAYYIIFIKKYKLTPKAVLFETSEQI